MTITLRPPRRLESYLFGEWVPGAKDGPVLLDAATGEPVASIDATGLDFAAALDYGRAKAGPKLRAMTFHERAGMLKALGLALMAQKEEFYAESLKLKAPNYMGMLKAPVYPINGAHNYCAYPGNVEHMRAASNGR